jgi:ribonuclease T2
MTPARFSLLLLGGFLSALALPPAFAAKLVDGSFLAVKDCPAYVSKAERTNPDDTRLVPGRIYPLFEVNFPEAPEAYRIRIENAEPRERWVSADCGEYPPKSSPADIAARNPKAETEDGAVATSVAAEAKCPTPPPGADACRTCGPADSWVMVLNWQPGLCQAGKKQLADQPECQSADPGLYQARNFTFRELRPLRRSCKKGLGFCGTVEREPKQLTDYPPLALADATRQSLARFMPGTAGDSGLERQTWHQYGSCTGFPEEAYFKLAVELVQQFNQSGMSAFMAENLGKIVRREEFFQRIEASLGEGARKHINIECGGDGRLLTGVVIQLASGVTPGADLKALIRQGPRAGAAGNCASRFVVDEIGFDAEPPKEPRPKRRPPPKSVPSAEPASPSAPEIF